MPPPDAASPPSVMLATLAVAVEIGMTSIMPLASMPKVSVIPPASESRSIERGSTVLEKMKNGA